MQLISDADKLYLNQPSIGLAQRIVCKSTHAYFSHILLSDTLKSSGVQEFLPQRLLITYFAASAIDTTSRWANLQEPPLSPQMKKALLCDLESCFDEESGGFCPNPCRSSTSEASIAMTFCALHIMETAGVLDEFLHTARRRLIKNFVLSCYVCGRGFSSVAAGFSPSGVLNAEVTLRESCSALMSLWLVSETRERCRSGTTFKGVLSSRTEYSRITVLLTEELNRDASNGKFGFRSPDVIATVLGAYVPHEGAFGACLGAACGSGGEGHSGLTFCGVVSLTILGYWVPTAAGCAGSLSVAPHDVLRGLHRYVFARRDHFGIDCCEEGGDVDHGGCEHSDWFVGFQGRPNKDSDTCYSFWLLSVLRILTRLSSFLDQTNEEDTDVTDAFLSQGLPSEGEQSTFSETLCKFTFQTAGLNLIRESPTPSNSAVDVLPFKSTSEMLGVLTKCPHIHHDPVHAYLGLAGVLIRPDTDEYALPDSFLKDIWNN